MRHFFLFIIFIASSFNTHAQDASTTAVLVKNAEAFAIDGNYEKAYDELAWVLRGNFRYEGIVVLKNFPQIADWRIRSIDADFIDRQLCAFGLKEARDNLDNMMESLKSFTNTAIFSEASQVIEAHFDLEAQNTLMSCEQKNAYWENLRSKNLAEEKAEKVNAANKLAPLLLRTLSTIDFCNYYGRIARNDSLERTELQSIMESNKLNSFLDQEARKRGIKLNKALILSQTIKIGTNECQVIAAWGMPIRKNRSVGSWGENKQLVYDIGGPYVYLKNGFVSSFQD